MGSVVFSVDAELGWGFSDHEHPPTSRLAAARDGWRVLLDVFDTHDVAATWGIVGHLFLEDCDGIHPNDPAAGQGVDWGRKPCDTQPTLRYGSDLIAEVVDATVDHELGSHSFSHVQFGAPETTREIARYELSAAIDSARSSGIEFDSFVFPRNDVGHRDLLSEFGFRCYRGAGSEPDSRFRRTVGKLLTLSGVDSVDLVTPTVDEYGLVNVPPSLYLFGFEGWPRHIVTSLWADPIVRLAKRGIDRASREEGLFHLWLHPNNLRTEHDVGRVRRIVAYAAARRDYTDLTIETMGEVAARTLDRESAVGTGVPEPQRPPAVRASR